MSSAEPVVDPNAPVEPKVEDEITPAGDVDADLVSDQDDDEDESELSDAAKKAISKRNKEAKSLRDRLRVTEKELASAKDKAAKYDELTEKEKSELVRLTERAERAEKALAEAAIKSDLKAIQDEWGFTDRQLKYIKGDTPEALREAAEEYAEDNGIEKPTKSAKDKVVAPPITADQVRGRQMQDDDKSTPAELAARIPRR